MWTERELAGLAVTAGVGCLTLAAAYHVLRRPRAVARALLSLADSEEDEAPDELYVDAISQDIMTDPAVLVGTGQVYQYSSIRAWLCTGARTCPRTNLALVDLEVRARGRAGGRGSAALAA